MEMNEKAAMAAETAKTTRSRTTLNPLHEAALRLASFGKPKSSSKTRDLVSMLLGHGARAWRGTQPAVSVHLYATSPNGKCPVRLHLG